MNARSETCHQLPTFRNLVNRRRCVILVEGFFEWHTEERDGERFKQPYFVQAGSNPDGNTTADDEDDRAAPLLIAGLWDIWDTVDEDGKPVKLYSYAIVTENSSKDFSAIHTRMPVMFASWDDADEWLRTDKVPFDKFMYEPALRKKLSPEHAPKLRWHPVDRKVSNMRYREPDTSEPLDLEAIKRKKEAASIKRFFVGGKKAAGGKGSTRSGAEKAASATGGDGESSASASVGPSSSKAGESSALGVTATSSSSATPSSTPSGLQAEAAADSTDPSGTSGAVVGQKRSRGTGGAGAAAAGEVSLLDDSSSDSDSGEREDGGVSSSGATEAQERQKEEDVRPPMGKKARMSPQRLGGILAQHGSPGRRKSPKSKKGASLPARGQKSMLAFLKKGS